jgi:hypothetical protein
MITDSGDGLKVIRPARNDGSGMDHPPHPFVEPVELEPVAMMAISAGS